MVASDPAHAECTVHPTQSTTPVKLFCGFHPEDREHCEALRRHLAPLVEKRVVAVVDTSEVPPGKVKRAFLEENVAEAQVLGLLVSSHFISDRLWWDFWTPIVDRASQNGVRLVPILVRSVELSNTSLAGRELLPRDQIAVRDRPDHETAWKNITNEIGAIVEEIRRAAPSQSAGPRAAAGGCATLEDVKRRRDHAYGLKYRGRGEEALEELHLALKHLDALIGADPDNASLKKEQAHLHDRIAQCEYGKGRFDAARAAFDRSFEIRTRLCIEYPSDAEALFDLSTSRFWRGYLSFLEGDLLRARDEQQAGMRACQNLYTRAAENRKAARSLVVLETDLGTTLWELGDEVGAKKHLWAALELARELAGLDPGNRQVHRDVSVGLFRLADVLAALGETAEATRLCEESIRMCWALTELAPNNVQWRRHLATARVSMGDIRLSCGELTLARGDYEFAVGTMGALAALEHENLQGRRHYALSERKLGDLLCRAGDPGGALAAYLRASSAMEAACASTASDRWNRELAEIHSVLSRARDAVPGAG